MLKSHLWTCPKQSGRDQIHFGLIEGQFCFTICINFRNWSTYVDFWPNHYLILHLFPWKLDDPYPHEGQAHNGLAHAGQAHEGHAHKGHAHAIRKRQAEIPIQISGRLDVSIGTQCVLNGRTFKSG